MSQHYTSQHNTSNNQITHKKKYADKPKSHIEIKPPMSNHVVVKWNFHGFFNGFPCMVDLEHWNIIQLCFNQQRSNLHLRLPKEFIKTIRKLEKTQMGKKGVLHGKVHPILGINDANGIHKFTKYDPLVEQLNEVNCGLTIHLIIFSNHNPLISTTHYQASCTCFSVGMMSCLPMK